MDNLQTYLSQNNITLAYLLLGVYCLSLLFVTIYCMMQLYLLWHYQRYHQSTSEIMQMSPLETFPSVTIQLPIFNERYVAARVIDRICALDYPKENLDIQVLDDSTDDTLQISQVKVNAYQALGFQIRLIHRTDRTGYKAGALTNGMDSAVGEFIAIFDADFLPQVDFLKQTLPYFKDPKIGVVQTRWTHLNEEYSLLTRLQAFQLNVHFTVEQTGRSAAGLLLQFNGTAGVWRRSTIVDAGGWQTDTLTEDLDLSFRAQLRGWKIKFLENIGSPAELPAEMSGIKSQQFRWMKGGAETARKILPLLWKSPVSFFKKILATLHLLSSAVFVFVFLTGVCSVPLMLAASTINLDIRYFSVSLIGLIVIIVVYYVANSKTSWIGKSIGENITMCVIYIPVFLAMSMGLSLHNSIAVLQGFLGRKTSFVRTPKFALSADHALQPRTDYISKRIPGTTFLEGILALYFVAAIVLGLVIREYGFIIFHLVLAFGYGSICIYTLYPLRR